MSNNSFIPPKLNYPLLWFTDFSLPFLLKTVHNIDSVDISEEDRSVIKSLRKERLIILSNHPTTQEPPVVYTLANMMSSRFHYMASREVFDWGSGFVGEFIQSIGAYSVIAGASDKESLKATREILSSEGGKLVLFPEGEPTSGLNDTLLPFQPGVAQLGFWGLEDSLKKDPDAKLYVLPIFIKYRMNQTRDWLQKDLDRSLSVLENRMGLTKLGKDIVHRFLSIGKKLVEKEEREYGIVPEEGQDFDYRLGKLRHTILDNISLKIDLPKFDQKENAILKLRKILSYLELSAIGVESVKEKGPNPEVAKWARKAAQKAYDYITMETTYLTSHPTAERLYEWLYRYEQEIFGETKMRPHIAKIKVAKPVLLNQVYEDYKKDKRGMIQSLTNQFKETLEEIMSNENRKIDPLFDADYKFHG
ncbi:lysophospholipid acyltransferase family protein [Leptospira sp. GIMC2001]|uniref:lysophospholipid acyltransferase family protein n=1 Tax=Leptospira sp. GIMC2001 TaxID=1513297 RepID=UPI00234B9D12|nr:lysophospholipid acyltransferase family protein [Leptospira sp. GIMC2001]WCL48421.1 lysophospholipid acyltransferase family protein [Leptospira sp. GIMC2001]